MGNRLRHALAAAGALLALGGCGGDEAPRRAEPASPPQAEGSATATAEPAATEPAPEPSAEAPGEPPSPAAPEAAAQGSGPAPEPADPAPAAPAPRSAAGGWREQRLGASGAEPFDHLGGSVAASGEVVVAGARLADGPATDSGAAYVYRRGPAGWREEARLAPEGAMEHDRFGNAVAIAGEAVVAGAHAHPELGRRSGSAYVFRRRDGAWRQEARLAVEGSKRFGHAVAGSGDRIAVGAPGDLVGGEPAGAVYVFRREATAWRREGVLSATDAEAGDLFGLAVGIAADTAAVGAPSDDEQGSMTGAVYVFRREGASWRQEAKLLAGDAAALSEFGKVLAFDGETLAVGAEGTTDLVRGKPARGAAERTRFAGAVYVFRRDATGWRQEAKLLAADRRPGDRFGNAVAVHGDTLAVGAHFADPAGLGSGAAYVFRRRGEGWSEETRLGPRLAAAGEEFGKAVAVHGGTIAVGSLRGGGESQAAGSVFVFEPAPAPR